MKPIREVVDTFLGQNGFTKALGQNFIYDHNILNKIVHCAGKLENVLEIGPGPGGLTQHIIAKQPKKFVAIEKDKRWVNALLSYLDHLNVINDDALKEDFSALFDQEKFKVIANLPYNISTPLLIKLCQCHQYIQQMVLMFQYEVGERIASPKGCKNYGRLSVVVQSLFDVEILFKVPASVFMPPPKVDSCIVNFIPHNRFKIDNIEKFGAFLHIFFSQRRKMMGSTARANNIRLRDEFKTLRPEQLSVEDFVGLYHLNAT